MVSWEQMELLIKGTNKRFEMVEENAKGTPIQLPVMIRTGDLLLRKIKASVSWNVSPYHVGIYCGRFVIEFTAPEETTLCNKFTSCSSNNQSGTVNMKSVKSFIANKPYRVLRLKMAIPDNFSDLVDDAMDYDGIYHPLTNNCLHFALRLLGLEPGYIPQSLPTQRDEDGWIILDDLGENAALTQRETVSQQQGNEVNLTL